MYPLNKNILYLFLGLFISIQFSFAQSGTDTTFFKNPSELIRVDSLKENNDSITSVSDSDTVENKADFQLFNFLLRLDSLDVYTYSFFSDSVNYTRLNYLDTTNHLSGEYNPTKLFEVSYTDLGIIGSAQQNQVFNPNVNSGFQLGLTAYDAYLWGPKNIQLYDTRTPYTKVFYLMGSKKENSLKVSHAQSFMDQQVSASFDFQLFNHKGAYSRQHTDVKSFQGGMGYRTKDSRYQANLQYYHNKLSLEENGGIQNLADFEENTESNREIMDVNLNNADNLIRKSGVAIKQSFFFSKAEPDYSNLPDTNIVDFEGYTVTHFKKPYFDPVSHLGRINYYFNFERQNYRYTDSDQSSKLYEGLPFYPTADSSSFFDTIGLRKYVNELTYSNSDYKDDISKPKYINFFFGGRHEYHEYYQYCHKQYFQHYAVIGGVFLKFTKQLSLNSDFAYYFGDYLNNDFVFNGIGYLRITDNLVTAGINLTHRSPDWFYHQFSSSRFVWDNNLDKTDMQSLFLKYERNRLRFYAKVLNITNHVFINEQLQPEQSSKNIQHILIQAQKDIRLQNLGADLIITYQNISHPDIIRIPQLTGRAKLFYYNILFDGALDLEMGVEIYYFSKYYADQYMPALRSYHIQNTQEIGGHPFIDVYLNAKIGKARLFVRYDHFNSSFMGYDYYASPSYPAQDASFRFGVSWILFN